MKRSLLVSYLDEYLKIPDFEDYGPQGLQVETSSKEVRRVALSVDTSPPVIEAAAAWGATMLIAHHGILWRSLAPIAGPLGKRVRLLMENGINLYGAHLVLDAHPQVGNNAVLAQMFGVRVESWWCPVKGNPIGVYGTLSPVRPLAEFVAQVESGLNTKARALAFGPDNIERVAIISGFGADEAAGAKAAGADTLLTGETSHSDYWAASDFGLNIIYAGHYATETVGVQALGEHLSQKFDLETKFLNFPTGM